MEFKSKVVVKNTKILHDDGVRKVVKGTYKHPRRIEMEDFLTVKMNEKTHYFEILGNDALAGFYEVELT